MKIVWNQVTWYSKLLAVLVAILTIFLGNYLWGQWQEVKAMQDEEGVGSVAGGSALILALSKEERQEKKLSKKAEQILQKMSPEEKVGMVLMPAWDKHTSLGSMKKKIEKYQLGGLMLLRKGVNAEQVTELKGAYVGNSEVPFLVAVDAEPSLMKYRLPKAGDFRDVGDMRSVDEVRQSARRVAKYLVQLGVNVNFAPVYDSNTNQAVIGKRSFGADTELISERAGAFAEVMQDSQIASTAKHFPGHGSVSGDTHKSLQTIKGELTELDNFKIAIADNIPLMMVGHLVVESNTKYDTDGLPATLSSVIMRDLLRTELGYKGVVITDAFNMGALNRFSNLTLKSLQAGADIVLMPRNFDKDYEQVLEKVKKDKDFAQRIDEKVRRIIKLRLSLKELDK